MPLATFRDVSGTLGGTTDALLISVVNSDDLNGDGYSDLIIAGGSSPSEGAPARQGLVYFGDGRGGFALADQTVFPWQSLRLVATSQIVTADFNRDGRPDVFVATFGKDGDPFPGEQNRLYLSTAGGRWTDATASLPQLNDNTHRVAIGDVNGDGAPDIYVGNIFGQQRILPYLLLNDGNGSFSRNTTLVPAGTDQLLDYRSNGRPFYTGDHLADLDGDGRPELILGAFGGANAQSLILWNTGTGYSADLRTALPPGRLADANRNVLDIETTDFNRDGRPDILMLSSRITFAADLTPTFLGWTLDLYLNAGNRTFTLATSQFLTEAQSSDTSATAAGPTFIDLIDINRDGALDIVFVLEGGGPATTPYILLNDGAGSFRTITRGDLSANAALSNRPVPVVGQDGVSFFAFDVRSGQIGYFAALATAPLPGIAVTTGSQGDDAITGGNANDTIDGLAGNDILAGGAGNDVLSGGPGNDTLDGGAGADRLAGGAGDDRMLVDDTGDVMVEAAGEGVDTVVVSAANYLLAGGASVERLEAVAGSAAINIAGNELDQLIVGNAGANIISGNGGSDTLDGGAGDDTYRVFTTATVLLDSGGFDTAYASGTSYFLYSTAEIEYLSTAQQNAPDPIYMVGNATAQLIVGNYGDNILNGRGGGNGNPDTLIGLLGNDIYGVFTQGDVVRENAGEGSDIVYANANYQLRNGSSIEALSAVDQSAATATTLTGNEVAQQVIGDQGANVLDGRGGNDTLTGLGGADTFAFSSALDGTSNVDTIRDFASGDRIGLASDVFANVTSGGIVAGEFVLGTAAADGDDRLVYDQATGRLFYDADGNGAGAAVLFGQLNPGTALAASDFTVIAPVASLPAA